jgi:hypothetical protein
MDKEILEQGLRNHFLAEVKKAEPSRDWWHKAIAHCNARKHRAHWFGLVPKTRLAWVLVPVLVLLVGGTVYGASSIVRELFHKWATDVEGAGLAQEMELSQTVDGVTVRLERAYADQNVVLVGFTVSGPEARYYAEAGKLTTADGQDLHGMIGMGVVPGSKVVLGSWQSSERAALITAFDASSLEGNPAELNLTLETRVADSTTTGESTTMGKATIGPFKFDFSIPFHAGKVIDIRQTVEAAGVPVTLEQVVISPWATRTVFSFDLPPEEDQNGCIPTASLILPGGNVKDAGIVKEGNFGMGPKTSFSQYFLGDYTKDQGNWSAVINNLKIDRGHGEGDELAGPWIFTIDVP